MTICEASNSNNILTKVIVPPRSESKELPFMVHIPVKDGVKPEIRLNPGVVGFYRVQYDDGLMSPILDALGQKKLAAKDRLCLVADTFALVSGCTVEQISCSFPYQHISFFCYRLALAASR